MVLQNQTAFTIYQKEVLVENLDTHERTDLKKSQAQTFQNSNSLPGHNAAMVHVQNTNTIETDTTAKKVVKAEVYDNFEQLQTTQQEWDDFVEAVGSEIFLTFDWCRIWWKYYGRGRDLKIFIFRDNANLVGIIPLFFEKIWLGPVSVRAGKIVGSDFTLSQFCLPIDTSYMVEVIEKLSELLSKVKWDILHIGPIAGLYKHYDELKNAFEKSLFHSHLVRCEDKGVQTYFTLAQSWEAQLANLSKNERRNIKRKCEALKIAMQNEPGELTSHFAIPENATKLFTEFVQMHQNLWQYRGKQGHFADWPKAFEFHKEMVEAQVKHNRLRMMICMWGSYCLGYEYAYKLGNKYFALLNARSEHQKLADVNIGTSIFGEQVKKAIDEKVQYIDAMRGKYDYKLRLGGKLFPIRSIYIIPKRPFTVIYVTIFQALARLLNLIYYKIWYCRIRPRLPLIRKKPLWKVWIRISGLYSR